MFVVRAGITLMIMSIAENIGAIRPKIFRTEFREIFRVRAVLRPIRNSIAHGFEHIMKRDEVQWAVIWAAINTELPHLRKALESAANELPQWKEPVPQCYLRISDVHYKY
jgi:uncharacterized protein with HEPN domain